MDRGRQKRKERRKKLERRGKIKGNPNREDALWVKKKDTGRVLQTVSLVPKGSPPACPSFRLMGTLTEKLPTSHF